MKYIIIALLPILLASCASAPTRQELISADYGRVMLQDECELQVKNIMGNSLKDPNSASYSFSNCIKMGFGSIPIMGIPKQFGYGVTVGINAKNSFGAYTGKKQYQFLFKNGSVIRKTKPGSDGYGQFPF